MSRVHDALRRAEMGGMMPPEEPPVVAAEVDAGQSRSSSAGDRIERRCVERLGHRRRDGPAAAQHTPQHAERGPGGAVFARSRIAPARSQQLPRNSGRRVPHAAHPSQPPAVAATAAHHRGHQSLAGRGQDVYRRQPGAGAIPPGGEFGAAGRFRSAAPHRAQPVSDRPRSRAERFPHRPVHLRAGHPPGGGHESVSAARRFAGEESAGTAQHAAGQAALRGTARAVSTGPSSIRRRCCFRPTPTCFPRWPTAPSWWSRSAPRRSTT